MKQMICTICGLVGSTVASFFGGWTSGMTTLLIFMCIDYVTGLMVAGIFKKEQKNREWCAGISCWMERIMPERCYPAYCIGGLSVGYDNWNYIYKRCYCDWFYC